MPSEVTESLLWGGASEAPRGGGIDLDEVVLRISACEEEDLTDFSESRLTRLDLEEDLLVSVTLSVLEELFLIFRSPFSVAGLTCLGTELRRYGGMLQCQLASHQMRWEMWKWKDEKGSGLKYSERGRRTHEESLVMQICTIEKWTYPSLGAFWVAMKELGNIGHDRLLVRTLHVNVFRVQKPGNSQFSIRNLTKNANSMSKSDDFGWIMCH